MVSYTAPNSLWRSRGVYIIACLRKVQDPRPGIFINVVISLAALLPFVDIARATFVLDVNIGCEYKSAPMLQSKKRIA
jgi:hypothetical protein